MLTFFANAITKLCDSYTKLTLWWYCFLTTLRKFVSGERNLFEKQHPRLSQNIKNYWTSLWQNFMQNLYNSYHKFQEIYISFPRQSLSVLLWGLGWSWWGFPLPHPRSVTCSLPESNEWFIEDQAFLRSSDLVSSPTLFPPSPVSKLYRRHTGIPRKRDNFMTGRGDGGGAKLYNRKKALGLYKSFNTLRSFSIVTKLHIEEWWRRDGWRALLLRNPSGFESRHLLKANKWSKEASIHLPANKIQNKAVQVGTVSICSYLVSTLVTLNSLTSKINIP